MSGEKRRKVVVQRIETMTDLLTAFRVRKQQLGLNMTKIDALAGFQFGYTGKVFSSPESTAHRRLTDFSLSGLLNALECELVMIPRDEEHVFRRLRLIVDQVRSGATHDPEPTEIECEKALRVSEKTKSELESIGAKGRAVRWGRKSRKTRQLLMKELARKRWADSREERLKRKRSEAARKAVKARWGKVRAEQKGRERVARGASAPAPRKPEPTG